MEALKQGADALFILLGGIMVLAMHAGFAFLELGTVRKKNQVNALVKILVDFSVSTVVYFVVGYSVAYGTTFFVGAEQLAAKNGYDLVKVFLTTLVAFFLAEMGDKTQIATVMLAAQYNAWFLVVAGTTLGMMLANAPVVWLGDAITQRVPLRLVHLISAGIFAVLGAVALLGWG